VRIIRGHFAPDLTAYRPASQRYDCRPPESLLSISRDSGSHAFACAGRRLALAEDFEHQIEKLDEGNADRGVHGDFQPAGGFLSPFQ